MTASLKPISVLSFIFRRGVNAAKRCVFYAVAQCSKVLYFEVYFTADTTINMVGYLIFLSSQKAQTFCFRLLNFEYLLLSSVSLYLYCKRIIEEFLTIFEDVAFGSASTIFQTNQQIDR